MVIVLLLGIALGSFINALVWRLALVDPEVSAKQVKKPKKKLSKADLSVGKGRSVCVHCGHQLAVKDLVPILSWLSLKGKCRYCDKSIAWQYPLVEALTGALFAFSYWQWPEPIELGLSGWLFGLWLLILAGMVAMSVYDIRFMLIPDKVLFPLIGIAVISVVSEALLADNGGGVIKQSVLGLLLVGGFFYAIFQISQGRWIGGGDVKLTFLMGIYLGLSASMVALAIGFYSATLIVLPLLMLKKITRKQHVPFGPFLMFGIIIAELFSEDLINYYGDLFLI